jgi:hypothetical protein
MIAVSRRFSKVFPLQVASNADSATSSRIGTGCTGTEGRLIRSIGERAISPSANPAAARSEAPKGRFQLRHKSSVNISKHRWTGLRRLC